MATRDPRKRKQAPKMPPQSDTSVASAGDKGVEAAIQAYIGRQLRAVYDEVANEPVPDKFIDLLNELERKKRD